MRHVTAHPPSTRLRLTASLAAGSLLLGQIAVPLAQAQTPPAPPTAQPAPPAGAQPASADPPTRVGSLSRIAGTVSFHTADETQWGAATLNYPVTSGNSFWTEPNAGADIDIGASRLTLAPQTEFDVDTLDDRTLATTEARGEMYVRLRDLPPQSTASITTPRGVVMLAEAGRYDIVAGDADHPTLVTVVEGAAQIDGASLSVKLGPHQTATVTGTESFKAALAPAVEDAFLRAQLARENPPAPLAAGHVAPPPVVETMTGAAALVDTGEWAEAPQYGRVWYPPVQRDWVPYRHGHWAWVAPWGWTWVDDAAWGFAPSHYGRWVEVNDRWGWTPVPIEPAGAPVIVERPAYAPAMVSFVDVAAGAAVGLAAGLAAGAAIGWIPLGPRQPYIPPYRVSEGYLARVNVTNVTNITNITNYRDHPPPIDQFANRGAATVVPRTAMAESQPIAAHAQAVAPQAFAAARPVEREPFAPTLATAGVTPAVARAYHLEPPAGGVAARPASPGPAVAPRGPEFGHGPLRPANAVPGPGPVPVPGAVAPEAARPEPGRPGVSPGAAVVGGAVVGGAAALGGAALLNRPRPTPGGTVGGPLGGPVATPHGPEAARPGTPQVRAPGPIIGATARPGTPELRPPVTASPTAATARPVAPAVARPGPAPLPAPLPAHPAEPTPRPVSAAIAPPRPAPAPRPAEPPAAANPAVPPVRPAAPARPAEPPAAAHPAAAPVRPAAPARPPEPAAHPAPAAAHPAPARPGQPGHPREP
jgi:hypothetical protein